MDPATTSSLLAFALIASTYVVAGRRGIARDRRGRRWPTRRTAMFVSGLAVLLLDVYAGIGDAARASLSYHVVEHLIMSMVAAPLLAAAAPVRLAFFALGSEARRTLASLLHSPTLRALTRPPVAACLFGAIMLVSHVPAVYAVTQRNDLLHAGEHALYLWTAVLMWAMTLRVDPLPHRGSPQLELACSLAAMLPMAVVATWFALAATPAYGSTVGDQQLASAIMWAGCLVALAMNWLVRAARARPAYVQTG